MTAQYVSTFSKVVNFTHKGDDTNIRQDLVKIYLVINTRLHHIWHNLKTVKIYSIKLIISENLAMSYEYHQFNPDVFHFFHKLIL